MLSITDKQLPDSENLLNRLPFSVYVVDHQTGKIIYANGAFNRLYPDWQNSHCHQIINCQRASCHNCKRSGLFDGDGAPNGVSDVFEVYSEAEEQWFQINEVGVYWGDGRSAVLKLVTNINHVKQMQNQLAEAHAALMFKHKELEHLASTDPLTQVYNRGKLGRIFDKELRHLQCGGETFSIISVDIDHFKRVNDTFGHAAGDKVLIAVARCMKNSLRSTDYLGRWGGEEFLILCPDTSSANALMLAERIRGAVAAESYCTGEQHTVSIGVATWRNGDTLDSLLGRSDVALYRAKGAGRNQVCLEEG